MEKKLIEKSLKLNGLTCIACENKMNKKISGLPGVQKADISYVTQILKIAYYEDEITLETIKNTIVELGYEVEKIIPQDVNTGENLVPQKGIKNILQNKLLQILGLIGLGVVVYTAIHHTIGFSFIPEISPNMSYAVLFVVGLMVSLHCVAMCAGINLSVCMTYEYHGKKDGFWTKLIPGMLYNLGRVVSYTIIGGIVGALGSVISLSNTGKALVSLAAGVFMIIMALNMLNIFPWLRKINPHMPKIFAKKIYQQKKNKGPFIVGLLNGLMPCGPLQAMQLYALGTGSLLAGALSMFVFSLGTVPLMFAFGALGTMLSSKFTKNMLKVSAILVIVLGLGMIGRSLAFTGVSVVLPNSGQGVESTETDLDAALNNEAVTVENTTDSVTDTQEEVQKITSVLESNSYPPITVTAGVMVEWTIQAAEGTINGCNKQMIIPEYDITQNLVVGDNVITFMPEESGTFGYSCWMGMIRSSITVVE